VSRSLLQGPGILPFRFQSRERCLTVEGVRLGDLHEESKISVRERTRHVRDRDREDELQHVVCSIWEVHARLRLVARELGLSQLFKGSKTVKSVHISSAGAPTPLAPRTSFTSFRTRRAAKSERMYMPGTREGCWSVSVTVGRPPALLQCSALSASAPAQASGSVSAASGTSVCSQRCVV
jgi:hypothetical protein